MGPKEYYFDYESDSSTSNRFPMTADQSVKISEKLKKTQRFPL